jgi:5S rRNA maturation endonuclease (ribonuclease M5)
MMVLSDDGFPANGREMKEAILTWVDEMNSYPKKSIILVEGKKDINALKELGIKKDMIKINKGLNLFDLISWIKTGKLKDLDGTFDGTLIILTDWDRKGGMLASRLKKACLHMDMDFDLNLRKDIASLTGKWIKDIESIPSFMSHLEV